MYLKILKININRSILPIEKIEWNIHNNIEKINEYKNYIEILDNDFTTNTFYIIIESKINFFDVYLYITYIDVLINGKKYKKIKFIDGYSSYYELSKYDNDKNSIFHVGLL